MGRISDGNQRVERQRIVISIHHALGRISIDTELTVSTDALIIRLDHLILVSNGECRQRDEPPRRLGVSTAIKQTGARHEVIRFLWLGCQFLRP